VDLAAKHGLHVTLQAGPVRDAETTTRAFRHGSWRRTPKRSRSTRTGMSGDPRSSPTPTPSSARRPRSGFSFSRRRSCAATEPQARRRDHDAALQRDWDVSMAGARGEYSSSNLARGRRSSRSTIPTSTSLAGSSTARSARTPRSRRRTKTARTAADFVLYRLWHDFHRWLYAITFISARRRCATRASGPALHERRRWSTGARTSSRSTDFHRESAKVEPTSSTAWTTFRNSSRS